MWAFILNYQYGHCLCGVQQEQINRIIILYLSAENRTIITLFGRELYDKQTKSCHSSRLWWQRGKNSTAFPKGSKHPMSRARLQLRRWSPFASHPQLRRPHPSLVPSDLHPRLFWLITPNVVLIKTGGVKGFSSPEKRVQIVAQWQIPSLAWEEMQPDNVQALPKWPEPD